MTENITRATRPAGYTFMCVGGIVYGVSGLFLGLSGILSLFTDPLLGFLFLYILTSFTLGILACFDLLWKRASGRKKLYAHLISQWLILIPFTLFTFYFYVTEMPKHGIVSGSLSPEIVLLPLIIYGLLFGLPLLIATIYWQTTSASEFLRNGLY